MGNSLEQGAESSAFHWEDIVYAETRTTNIGDGENLNIIRDLAGVIHGILRREVSSGRTIHGFEELQSSKNPVQVIVEAIRRVLLSTGNGSKETVPEGCVRARVTRFFARHQGCIATPDNGGKTFSIANDSRIGTLQEGRIVVLRPDGGRDERQHPTAQLVQIY